MTLLTLLGAQGAASPKITRIQSGLITRDNLNNSTYWLPPGYTTSGSQKWSYNVGSDLVMATVGGFSGTETLLGSHSAQSGTPGQWWRTVVDSSQGVQRLQLTDFSITFDLNAFDVDGETNSLVVNLIGTNGTTYYTLTIPNNNAGTTTFKDFGGTTRMSVGKGIAEGTTRRVILWRNGLVFGGSIDGTAFTPWTETSRPPVALRLRLDTPVGTYPDWGDIRLGNFDISLGSNVYVRDLPAGHYAAVYDNAGNQVDLVAADGDGSAMIECAGQAFPMLNASVRVYSDAGTTEVSRKTFTALRGGDDFHYGDLTYNVAGVDFGSLYATTQANSHNGVVWNGDWAYGLSIGSDNNVIAFGGINGGRFATQEITAFRGVVPDQHATCDIQADSSGYLHAIFGGFFNSHPLYYAKSNTPYGWDDWGTATAISGANGFTGGLLIDGSDKLHLLGTLRNASGYADRISYFSKTSGGSWSAETRLANGTTDWQWYFGDCVIGDDGSLNMSVFSYEHPGLGSHPYRNNYLFRSSNGGTTWGGVETGVTYTLPLTQNATTKVLDGAEQIITSDDTYIANLCADSSGNVHAVSSLLARANPYLRADYYRGTPADGWSLVETFGDYAMNTGAAISTHPLGLVIIAAVQGYSGNPGRLDRWYSEDGGDTWVGPHTLISGDDRGTYLGHSWAWAKFTAIPGSDSVRALWHSRLTGYSQSLDSYTGYDVSGEGVASLYVVDVPVLTAAHLAVRVWAQPTQTQGLAVAAFTRLTQTQGFAVVVATSSTARTTTQGVSVRVKVTGLTTTQGVRVAVIGSPGSSPLVTHDTYTVAATGGQTVTSTTNQITVADISDTSPLPA